MNELVAEKGPNGLTAVSVSSVETLDLSKVYWDGSRQLEVLRNISLRVNKGEGIAILGPSGSGKTTLLNVLSGLDRPSGGRVRLNGVWLDELDDSHLTGFRNRHIGFVFQFYHLLSEFSALENVMLPMRVQGSGVRAKAAKERAEALLERVGLKERLGHFPAQLSGGEQQRVAIARALANDPDLLFCDEPTGNLDLEKGREIADLLKGLFSQEGKTVLVVTHDERIAAMADRVWNIVDNRWQGT